jgi:hypothetical protein
VFSSDLPVIPPTGTIASSDFVRLFAENCVRDFPDSGDMARAFLEDGFVESEATQGRGERIGWYLRREDNDLRASISTVTVVAKRSLNFVGDELGSFYACSLTGDISDPAAFDAEVLGMVDAEGKPLAWQAIGDNFSLLIDRDGLASTIEADPPGLALRVVPPDNPPSCGGQTRCRVWTNAEMSIWVPADAIAVPQQ